jgi:hypothetical protein
LRQRIKEYRKVRPNFGILITGIATAGKTRTAMELIADANPSLVFIWPRDLKAIELNALAWSGSAILLADNLTLPTVSGDVPLPSSMLQLLQQSPKVIMVGTIRRNLLPEDLRGLEPVELTELEQASLHELAEYVAGAEGEKQGSNASAESILRRYNGHPAGLVAGLDAMRDIYHELDEDQRAALRGIKLLRTLGIQNLSVERVREATEVITSKQYEPIAFYDLLDELSETGLVSWAISG